MVNNTASERGLLAGYPMSHSCLAKICLSFVFHSFSLPVNSSFSLLKSKIPFPSTPTCFSLSKMSYIPMLPIFGIFMFFMFMWILHVHVLKNWFYPVLLLIAQLELWRWEKRYYFFLALTDLCCWFWRWRKGPWGKESVWPLQAEKGKEKSSPEASRKRNAPFWQADLNPRRSVSDFYRA